MNSCDGTLRLTCSSRVRVDLSTMFLVIIVGSAVARVETNVRMEKDDVERKLSVELTRTKREIAIDGKRRDRILGIQMEGNERTKNEYACLSLEKNEVVIGDVLLCVSPVVTLYARRCLVVNVFLVLTQSISPVLYEHMSKTTSPRT